MFNIGSIWKTRSTSLTIHAISQWVDLEDQLHDEDNNKVEYKDLKGLEQALKTTLWGKTPDYLQPIALRIEKAHGKATNVSHIPVQVLVCAAIKEMEDLRWSIWTGIRSKVGYDAQLREEIWF
ncbi:hypothetical protein PVK06_041534 [Gossypium arboreum]|uniref:Uncharacterized protein n=1 Tax=Gossypium arboreum TaxID=29729 RepID=A0ABR0N8H9_GOSAR|nr:hypothetical protein PVK06_041534 [Gossypium arboreum]